MTYRESYWDRNPEASIGAIFCGFIITLISVSILYADNYIQTIDNAPIQNIKIDSLVSVRGYTECVVIVDEKRYATEERPCKYKEGEFVNVKIAFGIALIIEDKETQPTKTGRMNFNERK